MRLLSTCIAAAALVSFAQSPGLAQPADMSKVEIRTQVLAPGVAVLFGRGGNIGLSYGSDGPVVIDDQYAPLSDKIVAAVRALDNKPIRFVLNTHWHGDHTGGNEALGKAGAVIIAHDNVRERMASDQVTARFGTIPASPQAALPVVTFADGVTFHLNGDTVHVIHVANAHTDGDSIIHWQKADILHMGDTFFHEATLPFIDLASGGSINGLIAAVDKGLAMAGPKTRIIPGHGPVAGRNDLLAYRAMLVDVRSKVASAMTAGQELKEVKAANYAAAYGPADGFISRDDFVEAVFESLRNPPPTPASSEHRH